MKGIRKKRAWTAVAACGLLLGAIGTPALADNSTDADSLPEDIRVIDSSELFTDRDKETGYKQNESVSIVFNHTEIQCGSDAAEADGTTVTIKEEGAYVLSGTLDDGQIIVDVDETEKVQLVLDNVSVSSSQSAAVYIKKADKVFITMTAGSENLIAAFGESETIDDSNIDAAIFSKEDVTLNGLGTLKVSSTYGHGIVSKDDLKVTGGTYEIESAGHGLSGKDSVRILDGTFLVTSGKDGIHSENSEDELLGYIAIEGGNFTITAEGDGMDAASILQVNGGTIDINAGGGSESAQLQSVKEMGGWGGFHQNLSSEEETDTVSQKGLKAGETLAVNNGEITIDSADDSMHSNKDLVIQNGLFSLTTGDDGMHADDHLIILDGTITITESYEGLEGNTIDICGGSITLRSVDDGLNAAGGNDQSGAWGFGGEDPFAAAEGVYICISGGVIDINADGDGIDSNGDLYVEGGEILVRGPSDSANGALDYSGEAVITGGVFAAVGASGMAQTFTSAENQGVIFASVSNQSAESSVVLKDGDGATIFELIPEKSYSSVVVSCPEIQDGETYTLVTGGTEQEITMDGLLYGSGNGMFGNRQHGDKNGGGRGNHFDQANMGEAPEDFELMSMEEPPEGFDPTGRGKAPENFEPMSMGEPPEDF